MPRSLAERKDEVMKRFGFTLPMAGPILVALAVGPLAAQTEPPTAAPQTAPRPAPSQTAQKSPPTSVNENVVVSATKVEEDPLEVPAAVTVITGAELRARGVTSLPEALSTVGGMEAFDSSDAGSGIPNIGLWGLKEFDAYLVEIDGVPAGGTFDPDLQQIDVGDIDRIEIVRGPGGVIHGSTAFAGVIAIYTRQYSGLHADIAGGSYGERQGSVSYGTDLPFGHFQVRGSADHTNGWRVRTDGRRDQLGFSLRSENVGGGALSLSASYLDRRESFGAPYPVEDATGALPQEISFGSNLAAKGTEIASRIVDVQARYDRPFSANLLLSSTTGFAHRQERLARSFVDEIDGQGMAMGAGTDFSPTFADLFEDLHLAWTPSGHRLVFGVSATRSTLGSPGRTFELGYAISSGPPLLSDIPTDQALRVEDYRTFAGVYAEDEWTPWKRVTFIGGIRYDADVESRNFDVQGAGNDHESRRDGDYSARAGAVFRLLSAPQGNLDAVDFHVTYNRTFKPAAFDPAPADNEGLLKPERSRSWEAGVKVAAFDRRLDFSATAFDMRLSNLVVSVVQGGVPTRVNAGQEKFQGFEFESSYRLPALEAMRLFASYAYHNPKFVKFEAVNENGIVENFAGNSPELVPRHQARLGAVYAPAEGPGGSLTLRYTGTRFLDRDNVLTTGAFWTVDASLSYPVSFFRVELVGRNLTNKRYFTTDSELQDGLLYISGPRSFLASVVMAF
jgi:outer membrane receptor protein involved in Fe transport